MERAEEEEGGLKDGHSVVVVKKPATRRAK
jgi:hypothetical protein